jgi:SAM-dependent methyltransferase
MTKQNKTLEVYTKENSAKWNSNGGGDGTARPWVLNQVRELAIAGKKTLLDVGSGTGRWTKQFAQYLESVVGVDVSSEMVDLARATNSGENISYIQRDILHGRLGKFDIVTALAMLQHTRTRKELHQVYKKIGENLNPSGHFVFYAPHPINVFNRGSRLARYEFDKEKFSYLDNFPFVAHISMEDGTTRTGSGYHHSMQEYLGELIRAGFRINKIEELVAYGDSVPSALVVDAIKDTQKLRNKEVKGGRRK